MNVSRSASVKLFGPEKIDYANTWRALTAIASLVIGGLLLLLFPHMQWPSEWSEVSVAALDTVAQAVRLEKIRAGGDVLVPPPVIVKPPRLPKLAVELPPPDRFTAKSIMVKDHQTGVALYRKDEYASRSIASVTKLMSALVLLEKKPDWSATTTVVGEDSLDTHMYRGDTYTLDQLWHAAMVGSSNKAILTLAQALDWPVVAFVERMNQKAQELGMKDTAFVDPTGIEADNVSSASDLAMLLAEALKQERISSALLTKEYNLYSKERKKRHHLWSTNWLLLGWIQNDLAELRGGKTGYIPESGYNFVLQAADKNGHLIDLVVLGADSHEHRFTEARDLAELVFKSYQWPEE